MQFAQKLAQLEKRFDELTQFMADPAVISDADQYRKITKEQAELSEIVGKYREWKDVEDSLSQARAMLQEKDPDLRAMAEEEVARQEPELTRIEEAIKILLLPKDPKTIRTWCWKSAPAPAATKPRCSRRKFSACIRATPNRRNGRSK